MSTPTAPTPDKRHRKNLSTSLWKFVPRDVYVILRILGVDVAAGSFFASSTPICSRQIGDKVRIA